MSTDKAKKKAKSRRGRTALKELAPSKGRTQRVTGGSNANFPPVRATNPSND